MSRGASSAGFNIYCFYRADHHTVVVILNPAINSHLWAKRVDKQDPNSHNLKPQIILKPDLESSDKPNPMEQDPGTFDFKKGLKIALIHFPHR